MKDIKVNDGCEGNCPFYMEYHDFCMAADMKVEEMNPNSTRINKPFPDLCPLLSGGVVVTKEKA